LRSGHLWLASFACCPLAGWPLLAHPSYRRFSLPCRLGLAAGAGSVLLAGWMTLFALADLAWHAMALVAVAALTAFLLRFLLSSEGAAAPGPAAKLPSGLLERLALALSAMAVLAALAAAASAAATSHDLLLIWGTKAQAFAAARTLDAAFLREPLHDYFHVSYPPLVTNLYAFASIVGARFAWGAAMLTFPLCLAVLAVSVPGVLRLAAPRPIAWAVSAFVVSAFGYLGNDLDVAGNAEPWLWIYETLAMALLVGSSASTRAAQLMAGLLLAGAATAKVEGLPFVLAAVALFLFLRRKELRLVEAASLLLVPTAVSLLAWFAFGATRHLFRGYEQYGRLLEIHWPQLGRVLAGIGGVLWSAGWALPWLIPLAALAAPPHKSRIALLPAGAAAALAAFFVFTYLHVPDASLLIAWSAGRVMSPLLALLATSAACRTPRADLSPGADRAAGGFTSR
jgi:hypothetical protein